MIISSEIDALLNVVERVGRQLGYSLRRALQEKAQELEFRQFLRCIPNGIVKETQAAAFLEEVLGEPPSPLLLERIQLVERGRDLDDDEYLELERQQGGRCALCGVLLLPRVRPHVDHRIPIALRGADDLQNLQLLCARCNLGKRALIGWIMGAPFLQEGVTVKVRYCVLTRDDARCRWLADVSSATCGENSRTSELDVVAVVPPQRGGRLIFDNLRVLCARHARFQRETWLADAEARVEQQRARHAWAVTS
jgi:5-methylcytosine-specific restriction endonuclease McrA